MTHDALDAGTALLAESEADATTDVAVRYFLPCPKDEANPRNT